MATRPEANETNALLREKGHQLHCAGSWWSRAQSRPSRRLEIKVYPLDGDPAYTYLQDDTERRTAYRFTKNV